MNKIKRLSKPSVRLDFVLSERDAETSGRIAFLLDRDGHDETVITVKRMCRAYLFAMKVSKKTGAFGAAKSPDNYPRFIGSILAFRDFLNAARKFRANP